MENQTNNVIKFPKQKKQIRNDIISEEEIQHNENLASNLLEMKINHINESLFLILPKLFQSIDLAGGMTEFYSDTVENEEITHINLIVESIRSFLYKRYELDHPLQKLAEEVFVVTDDGSLNIKENVALTFNQKQPSNDPD